MQATKDIIPVVSISLFFDDNLSQELLVDSKPQIESTITLYLTTDYHFRHIFSRLCDSFESRKLDFVRYVKDVGSFAGALIKRSIDLSAKLNEMSMSGEGSVVVSGSFGLSSQRWIQKLYLRKVT